MKAVKSGLVLLTLSLLSGCVVETVDTGHAPSYYGAAPSLPYVGEPVLVQTPYYVSGGVSYYYASGQYFYVSSGRRYYVTDLPRIGIYNNRHPYYTHRAAITRTVVHTHTQQLSRPSLARPISQTQRVVDRRYQSAPAAHQPLNHNLSRSGPPPRQQHSMQSAPAQGVPNSPFSRRGPGPTSVAPSMAQRPPSMAQRPPQSAAPSHQQAAPAKPSGGSFPGKRKEKKD